MVCIIDFFFGGIEREIYSRIIVHYLNPDPHACVIPLFVDDVTNQKIDRVANCGLITNNWNILFKLKIKVNGHKETKKKS